MQPIPTESLLAQIEPDLVLSTWSVICILRICRMEPVCDRSPLCHLDDVSYFFRLESKPNVMQRL